MKVSHVGPVASARTYRRSPRVEQIGRRSVELGAVVGVFGILGPTVEGDDVVRDALAVVIVVFRCGVSALAGIDQDILAAMEEDEGARVGVGVIPRVAAFDAEQGGVFFPGGAHRRPAHVGEVHGPGDVRQVGNGRYLFRGRRVQQLTGGVEHQAVVHRRVPHGTAACTRACGDFGNRGTKAREPRFRRLTRGSNRQNPWTRANPLRGSSLRA